MTEAETIEFWKRYRRWQRRRWLRPSYWRRRVRDRADFFECSFCKNHFPKNGSRGQGVLGVDDFICRDCVATCAEAMAEADASWRDRLVSAISGSEPKSP